MSFYHGSSKHACRVRVLHPGSTGAGHVKNSAEIAQFPWEPFAATMAWPPADTRQNSSFIEGLAWTGASVRAPIYQELLRGNGFERTT
jgi:hypothetical protein